MPIAPEKTLEELFKNRLSQLKADSEYATGAITQHVRAVSYGLVALIIPFVTAEPAKLPKLLQENPKLALSCAALGFLAVCSDALQNYFADRCARKELERIVGNLKQKKLAVESPADFMMSISDSPDANMRKLFFRAKIFFALAGAISLLIILANAFL